MFDQHVLLLLNLNGLSDQSATFHFNMAVIKMLRFLTVSIVFHYFFYRLLFDDYKEENMATLRSGELR